MCKIGQLCRAWENFIDRRGKERRAEQRRKQDTMGDGLVIACHSADTWRSKLQEANSSGKLVVVDFTATWCGPCRIISPIFVDLSKRYTNVVFLKVDVDELPDVTAEWEVQAMPTFIFIKDGKLIDKVVGARKEELEKKVAALSQA